MNKKSFLSLMLVWGIILFFWPTQPSYAAENNTLQIEVKTDKLTYELDENIEYEITVKNPTGNDVKDVVVTNTPPGEFKIVSDSVKVENDKVVWEFGEIKAFESKTITFTTKLPKKEPSKEDPKGEEPSKENPKDEPSKVDTKDQPSLEAPKINDEEEKVPSKEENTPPAPATGAGSSSQAGGEEAPKTGDTSSSVIYIVILGISLALMVFVIFAIRSKKLKKGATFLLVFALLSSNMVVAKAEEVKETFTSTHKIKVNDKEYVMKFNVKATVQVDTALNLKGQRELGVPTLNWNEIEGATYQIYKGADPKELSLTSENYEATEYQDLEAKVNQSYYYSVHAMKDGKQVHKSTIIFIKEGSDDDLDGVLNEQEDKYGTDKNKADTDEDGLSDGNEVYTYGTDPLKPDTDGDRLTDFYETQVSLNPLKKDSDDNDTSDGMEDLDSDGLSNFEEQTAETDARDNDTDKDSLNDGKEVNELKTSPIKKDTDNDLLDDDSEVTFGTDPLNPDTDGNGVLDGAEKREQTVKEADLGFQLDFAASGDASKTTIVEKTDVSNDVGTTGMFSQIDITSSSEFTEAGLTFTYDPASLGTTNPEDLRIFYYNEETRTLELLPDQVVDPVTKTVKATTTHFSTYVLSDMRIWASTWSDTIEKGTAPDQTGPVLRDTVFVIDSSGSMSSNDRNNYRISGTESIINQFNEHDFGAVIDFDSSAKTLQHFTENKNDLLAAVRKIDDYGGTNIGAGVFLGLEEFKNSGREGAIRSMILLTDGDGSYDQKLTQRAVDMGVKIYTIGLTNSVNHSLLQGIADTTKGHYYHVNDAKDLEGVLLQTGEKVLDTDSDQLPDWVEKKGFYIKGTLEKKIETNFELDDSDNDTILDKEEIGDWYYDPDTDKVFVSRDKVVDGKPNNPVKSDPKKEDTDDDGDKDAVDDKPEIAFEAPVILVHGFRSDSNAWGYDTLVHNGPDEKANDSWDNWDDDNVANGSLGGPKDYVGHFFRDTLKDESFKDNAYKEEADINYWDIDAQFIRDALPTVTNISKKRSKDDPYFLLSNSIDTSKRWDYKYQMGPVLEYGEDGFGIGEFETYKRNETMFVYNWENYGHVHLDDKKNGSEGAAGDFNKYLKNLTAYLLENAYGDFTLQDPDTKKQRMQFDTVAHSTGGLVVRYYIENLFQDNMSDSEGDTYTYPNIRKFIGIGVPNYGSNLLKNTGDKDSTTLDLDREDSYLFFDKNSAARHGEMLSHDHEGNNDTDSSEYYAIAGVLATETFWKSGGYESDEEPILFKARDFSSESDDHNMVVYDMVNEVLDYYGKKNLPKLDNKADELLDENPVNAGGDKDFGFGDAVVQVGSALGIPSRYQTEKQSMDDVPFDARFLYVGHTDQAHHSSLEHNYDVIKLVYRLLKDKPYDDVVDWDLN